MHKHFFFYFLNKNAKIKRIPASGDFGFQQINLANTERKKSIKICIKVRFHILMLRGITNFKLNGLKGYDVIIAFQNI